MNEITSPETFQNNTVTTDDLREDVIVEASDVEKRLIIDSFPNEKDNYMIVPKVIEE
jgi:Asp-tRNA(Asn)/Glu-tRNA(Gln) amidotransferase C subunit